MTYQPKTVNLKSEDEYQGKPRGLGDVVHTVIKAVGLDRLAPKGCGCSKRRKWLNDRTKPVSRNLETNEPSEALENDADFL
jgi:hypothetical protein